ncbi:DUF4390 domain-containing protein [Herbaspirillum camelliae]|uniref:DUF4390 domain-containing protein n=1 Tax=Herbaspirillum camelliae TaxID=1892903 RepID=UPI000A887E7E|nr:DUF4390 domain-containing protein [Herbaspirillum camelliae]
MNLTQSDFAPSHRQSARPAAALGRPPSRLLAWLLPLLALLLALAWHPARAAEITVSQASIEHSDEGYRLSVSYDFDLNRGLEDALSRGVPLYFTTDVQLTRRRWYWFDESSVSATRTVRLSYNVLTRQYHTAISGQLQQSFTNLDDALTLIRRPPRWLIADNNTLKTGDNYNVGLRMRLDVAQLPKPFQVNALNNSDWRLSSDWIEFTYKPE